jgi:hypothetical protein
MNKIFDGSKISTFRDLKELATTNKSIGRRNMIIEIDERAIEELRGYIYKLDAIKFYIEQSDIKNMLWGKEIMKIIGGNDD